MPAPVRASTSTAPVSEFRRNSRFGTPDSSTAFTVCGKPSARGAPRADGRPQTVKAVELSGVPNLLFRRNSLTGAVEVLPRTGAGIELNTALHA